MPAMSTVLQTERRPARFLFCPSAVGRSDGADDLWTEQRVLCRSDREEAAEPFFAGNERAFLRHSRMQPWLPVLSKLGHLQSTRMGQARRCRVAGADRARSGTTRLSLRRVHLQ